MTDLSGIPQDQLIARLRDLSSGKAQPMITSEDVGEEAQQQASKPQEETSAQPQQEPTMASKMVSSLMLPAASYLSNAYNNTMDTIDDVKMGGRALAALPMGVAQLAADHLPYIKDTDAAKHLSESISNVQNDTNNERKDFDARHGIGESFLDNVTNPSYLTERGSELIPQIFQGGFIGKILKPLQFAGQAAPVIAKVGQYATNVAAGAGTGAAFGGSQPQTGSTVEERDQARGDSAEGGALLGGALSSLAPAASGAYNYVSQRLSPLVQAAKRLREIVGTDSVPDFIKNIDENTPTAAAIPGYKPTTAQLAENPGMAALERGSRSPASPLAGEIGAQDINNRTAVSNMFEGISPENQPQIGPWGTAPGEAGDAASLKQQAAELLNSANAKTKTKLSAANQAATAAGENAQKVSAIQAETLPPEDTGDISSQLNEKLLPQYKNDRQVKNDLFQNIDPNGKVPVGTGKLKETLQGSLNNISSPYAREAATPGIADEIMTLPDTISFKQLQEYRPVLSDEIQKARLAGDGLKAKVLGDLKGSLESYTPDIAESNLPEHMDASARAKNAMDFYANTFAPKWKNGPGQQFAKGVNTYNPVAPETVASKFIRPGNAGAGTLRNLNEMVKDDPTIQPIIENYALGDLQQQKGLIDESGIIDPKKIDAWMQKNYQTLKMNPDLATKVGNMRDSVGTANEASDDMAQALKQRQQVFSDQQKALNDSALSKLIGKENTRDVVRSALSSDTPGKDVRSLINIAKQDASGKALKGLQQATYDHLKEDLTNVQGRATQDATLPLSMAKLDTYLDNNAKTNAIKMIIGQDGLDRLTAAKKGLQLMNTMSNFQSIPGSATSLNQAAEGLTKRMFKSAIDMVTGGQGKILNLGILQADKALQGRVGEIMQKAVVDPEFAKSLITYKAPQKFAKTNKIIKSGLPQAVIGQQIGQSEQQGTSDGTR